MEFLTIFMIVCLASTGWSSRMDAKYSETNNLMDFGGVEASKIYNVLDFGAVGDGQTDDTQAFEKAWAALCFDNSSNVPLLLVPSNNAFLLKPVTFEGPCKSASVQVEVEGYIIAAEFQAWSGLRTNKWIEFSYVNRLDVHGHGEIDGNGGEWWSSCGGNCLRPSALTFTKCDNLQLTGLRFINSQRNHISISGCKGATLSGLSITAPEDSPNTDGIDISSSTNVDIRDSSIGTGDDCIAINHNTFHVKITGLQCGPGHGISVGSLGRNGAKDKVKGIYVKNCKLTRTMNGVRIKTWPGGSGYASKIRFEDIRLIDVSRPIIIDQYYFSNPNDTSSSAVKVSDVTYIGVYGSSASKNAITLNCSRTVGCTNIYMEGINIKLSDRRNQTYATCINARGRSKNTHPYIPCLS